MNRFGGQTGGGFAQSQQRGGLFGYALFQTSS